MVQWKSMPYVTKDKKTAQEQAEVMRKRGSKIRVRKLPKGEQSVFGREYKYGVYNYGNRKSTSNKSKRRK